MAAERWVVYATFDATGAPAPFVEEQLTAYRQVGFKTIVVDTSPTLSPEREAAWQRSSTQWLKRSNTGYDFGSYRRGLRILLEERRIPLEELDVVFANDSCYGPYSPLADVFGAFDALPRDGRRVFGITESHEVGHHLQSYWLYFRADVVHHASAFFEATPEAVDRDDAIHQGEVGFSRFVVERGCELVAWCPIDALVRHFADVHGTLLSILEFGLRRRLQRYRYTYSGDRACLNRLVGRPFKCNPTTAFGTHMHYHALTPFVKRNLVRDNPDHDAFVPISGIGNARDNATVHRLLRETERYRQRYGAGSPSAAGARFPHP